MKGKETIKSLMTEFFVIVTLINIATFILGTIFRSDDRFGYQAFLSPIIYGVFSMIPCALFYSKKELSFKQALIRNIFQLFLIEVILVFIAFGSVGFQKENISTVLAFCGSIFIVYVLVDLITWFLDSITAKKMTEDLMQYQSRQNK